MVSKIVSLYQRPPGSLSETETFELSELQNKLDEIYKMKKQKGKVQEKWLEEGEQKLSYFFNLEKSHGKINTIKHLNISVVVTDDPKHCTHFIATCITQNIVKSQSPAS